MSNNKLNLCQNCGCSCILISESCIYEYGNLEKSKVKLSSIKTVLVRAHAEMKKTFPKCFKEICEALKDKETPLPEWMNSVLESEEFKIAIGAAIWYYWIKLKGGGEATEKGYVGESGDGNGGFIVRKPKEITITMSCAHQEMLSTCKDFQEWMIEQKFPCACPPKIEVCPKKCTDQPTRTILIDYLPI